jgi:small subunit ribosomal protein S16
VVRIRLRRMGATKRPTYRVVIADQHSPRNGRFVEIVGTYNPTTEPATIDLKSERISYWMGVGAQPSESAMRVLKSAKLVDDAGKFIQAA